MYMFAFLLQINLHPHHTTLQPRKQTVWPISLANVCLLIDEATFYCLKRVIMVLSVAGASGCGHSARTWSKLTGKQRIFVCWRVLGKHWCQTIDKGTVWMNKSLREAVRTSLLLGFEMKILFFTDLRESLFVYSKWACLVYFTNRKKL